MKKLKPCPIRNCKSPEVVLKQTFGIDKWYIYCRGCGLVTKLYNTKEETVQAWNKRSG